MIKTFIKGLKYVYYYFLLIYIHMYNFLIQKKFTKYMQNILKWQYLMR